MPRYMSAPVRALWVEDDVPERRDDGPVLQVDDSCWTRTGLLDADGRDIWRGPNPIGFLWDFGQ